MIRPFDLLDVPLIAQLESQGTPLSTDALTRGARPLHAALASFFSLHSRGEYTVVMPDKLKIDLNYIDRYSFWTDLKILAQTARALWQ